MKKVFLTASLALLFVGAMAQEEGHGYLVMTKNVEKSAAKADSPSDSVQQRSSRDFLSQNFQYKSLCDWTPGMKFMVLPEKYDLVVKTFHDGNSGFEVSSVSLRYKIMEYKGYREQDGRWRVCFTCVDNGKEYYYEIPGGSFDDYCYGKMGVPTLAYLGDVDIARDKLEGKTLYTKGKIYRVDTPNEGRGYREIVVDDYEEVVVKRIGVGSRSFPVKIIVATKDSMEFYQNVAMSKTNCGMRDDEFVMDSIKHTFYGAFEMEDEVMEVLKDYNSYLGKTIHTRHRTAMFTRGDGKDRMVNVPKMTSFTVENIIKHPSNEHFIVTLKELESRREYFKETSFVESNDVAGAIDGKEDNFFGFVFAMGEGKARKTSTAARAAIREGRVIQGMTEDEVILAMGEEPASIVPLEGGRFDWVYKRSKKDLVVHFFRNARVEKYETRTPETGKAATKRTTSGNSVRRPAAKGTAAKKK